MEASLDAHTNPTAPISPTLPTGLPPHTVHPWESLNPTQRQRIQQAVSDSGLTTLITPDTIAQLAEVVTQAHEQRTSLLITGAGSKLDWGRVGVATWGVSTQRLDRLIDHAVGDLTVTVEAGMPFARLQAMLAEKGQFCAIDPMYAETATIGGMIATGDTGSWRHRYNSVRDMLLGISFVRSDGQIAKAGGRVVKNVAGYDLMKLFTGSYGTLGILTQVTLRVYPLPEASQTVILTGEPSAIAQATHTLLQSALTPTTVDVLSTSGVTQLGVGSGMGLRVRFQTLSVGVQQQSDRLRDVGQALGLTVSMHSGEEEAELWTRSRQMMIADRSAGMMAKFGVRSSEAVALLTELENLVGDRATATIHAGSGLGYVVLQPTVPVDVLLKLRSFCEARSGFLSVLEAPLAVKRAIDVWGYPGNALELMRTIKQKFDPHHCLNPQRFVGGI